MKKCKCFLIVGLSLLILNMGIWQNCFKMQEKMMQLAVPVLSVIIPENVYAHEISDESQESSQGTLQQSDGSLDENNTDAMQDLILEQFDFNELDNTLKDLFPENPPKFRELLGRIISGEDVLDINTLQEIVTSLFAYALKNSRKSLFGMIIVALVAAVFSNISKIFQSRQVSEVSFYVSYLLMIALTLHSFSLMFAWVQDGISKVVSCMSVFCPVYFLAISLAKGSVTAGAFYNLVLFVIYLTEVLLAKILLPLIQIYMMIRILNFLSEEEYLSRFSELIGMLTEWMLKAMLAFISGLNLIQGLIHPAIDTMKRSAVAKGAEAIPGVGDILGGMTEVAIAVCVLIKNGIGMTGAILCVMLCLIPFLQIAVVTFFYKLTAAVLEPISDKRMIGCIEAVGEGSRLLMKAIMTMGMMFLITIAIVAVFTNQ